MFYIHWPLNLQNSSAIWILFMFYLFSYLLIHLIWVLSTSVYVRAVTEIAQALYNPIAYQSQIEQLERRTRQLSVFDDDVDQQQLVQYHV